MQESAWLAALQDRASLNVWQRILYLVSHASYHPFLSSFTSSLASFTLSL
jgi:hypothetical protein